MRERLYYTEIAQDFLIQFRGCIIIKSSKSALLVLPLAACLAACGGGSSGISSTPVPTGGGTSSPAPSPPPAEPNTEVTDLKSDENFIAFGASSNSNLAADDLTVIDSSVGSNVFSIRYDASSESYTVSNSGRAGTFGPANIIPQQTTDQLSYSKGTSTTSETLDLVFKPQRKDEKTRYVALGFWQNNQLANNRQTTEFTAFAYGLATEAEAVPISGLATYDIEISGVLLEDGSIARSLWAPGTMEFDFAAGYWQADAFLSEYEVGTEMTAGGFLPFEAAGQISSGNGFSGIFSYVRFSQFLTKQPISGTINGGFFGPAAEEVGAAFSGGDESATINGAITGVRNPISPERTLTIANPIGTNAYQDSYSEIRATIQDFGEGPVTDIRGFVYPASSGAVTSFDGSTLTSSGKVGTLSPVDFPSGDPGYAYYSFPDTDGAADAPPVKVLHPGQNGGPIELTYSGFGSYLLVTNTQSPDVVRLDQVQRFFAFGDRTKAGFTDTRKGSASYSGIAIGSTTNASGILIDVDGTSAFLIDFDRGTYSGMLDLHADDGGTFVDLGEFGFSSTISNGLMDGAALPYDGNLGSAADRNRILPSFYGTTGEEIIAPFSIIVGGVFASDRTAITGIAAAKRD